MSPRTFFRYFGNKEGVLFAEQDEMLGLLRTTIRSRPAGEGPYEVLRHTVVAMADHYTSHREEHLRRARLVQQGAAIEAYQRAVLQPQWETVIAEELAVRLGVDPDQDVRPWLVAGLAMTVMTAVTRLWVHSDGAGAAPELLAAAFATLEAVVGVDPPVEQP